MTATLYPEVLWAQRSGQVFLTVKLADCAKPEIKLEEQSLDFKGTVGDKTYAFTIPFFGPIDLAESKQSVSAREIFFCLQKALPKKEDGTEDTDFEAWWPTLQKGAKLHFVKTDFARWRDEDE
ncbi:HSP20-like chaperone, partial [Caulochytrium protostelioides]